jgi:succinoglycan biosynthesis transport protein ExoP
MSVEGGRVSAGEPRPLESRRLDLRIISEALIHRWRLVLLAVIVVPLVALAAWFVVKPKVKMTALIAVQDNMKLNPVFKDMAVEWSMRNELPLVTGILQSRSTLERVLRDLGSLSEASTNDDIDVMVRDFQTKLEVYPEGGNLIRVAFVDRDSERAFRALDRLTDTLVDEMLRPQKEALDQSVKFLNEQVTRLEGELKGLEEQLKTYRTRNSGDPELRKVNLESRARLANTIVDTETSLVAAEQRVRLAGQRLLRYDPESKALREQKTEAQERLDKMRGAFTDRHPQVRAALAEIARLEKALSEREKRRIKLDVDELQRNAPSPEAGVQARGEGLPDSADIVIRADDVMSGDLLTYQAATSEAESLRHKLELLKQREGEALTASKDFAEDEQAYARLVRSIESKSKTYTALSEKYEDALVSRELNRNEEKKTVWIVERPTGPLSPRRLPLGLLMTLAPIIGLILGAFLALGFESLDRTVRSEDEIEELAGAPVVGTLPWLPSDRL